jgi:hypothetical protein
MKLISIVAAAASICAASPAFSSMTFDFEDVSNSPLVTLTGGAAVGIKASDWLTPFVNDGSSGTTFTLPAVNGNVVMYVVEPTDGTRAEISMSSAIGGFADAISFDYASTDATTVNLRDGSGTLLYAWALAATGDFNTWATASKTFTQMGITGLVNSIDFTGTGAVAVFDNVTVNAVPLPAAALLFPMGAAALGISARRKRKQA